MMTKSHRSTRAAAIRLLPLLSVSMSVACAFFNPEPLPDFQRAPPIDPQALQVRLIFGKDADLDLHVTDPSLETVYFGNSPSRAGGALDRDRRCDDPAPRMETVTFRDPKPGLYRVGVDHVRRCTRTRDAIPYAIEIHTRGARRVEVGRVAPGVFESVALEFELRR